MTAAMVAIVVSIAAAISFLVCISPPRDEVEAFDYPPEFFCASSENRIDNQTDGNAQLMLLLISYGTLGKIRTERPCFRN